MFRQVFGEDESVLALRDTFEVVEWKYDGVNGKVVEWTRDNGSTYGNTMEDHASELLWVLSSSGEVVEGPKRGYNLTSGQFAKFLQDAHDKCADGAIPIEIDIKDYVALTDLAKSIKERKTKFKSVFKKLDKLEEEAANEATLAEAAKLRAAIEEYTVARMERIRYQYEYLPIEAASESKDFLKEVSGTPYHEGFETEIKEIEDGDNYKQAVKIAKELATCREKTDGKELTKKSAYSIVKKLQKLVDESPDLKISEKAQTYINRLSR